MSLDATWLKASSKLNDAAGECTAAPERCPYPFWAPLARKVDFISARPPLKGEKDARCGWLTSGVPEGDPSRASSMAAAYAGQGRARKPAPCVERVPHFRLKPSRSRRCPAARAAGLVRRQISALARQLGGFAPLQQAAGDAAEAAALRLKEEVRSHAIYIVVAVGFQLGRLSAHGNQVRRPSSQLRR